MTSCDIQFVRFCVCMCSVPGGCMLLQVAGFQSHFAAEVYNYGKQVIINLLDQKGQEKPLFSTFTDITQRSNNNNIRWVRSVSHFSDSWSCRFSTLPSLMSSHYLPVALHSSALCYPCPEQLHYLCVTICTLLSHQAYVTHCSKSSSARSHPVLQVTHCSRSPVHQFTKCSKSPSALSHPVLLVTQWSKSHSAPSHPLPLKLH